MTCEQHTWAWGRSVLAHGIVWRMAKCSQCGAKKRRPLFGEAAKMLAALAMAGGQG